MVCAVCSLIRLSGWFRKRAASPVRAVWRLPATYARVLGSLVRALRIADAPLLSTNVRGLADGGADWFVPRTRFRLWMSQQMWKILSYTPWKNAMIEVPLKIGNSIRLRDYGSCAEASLELLMCSPSAEPE